MYIFPQKDCSIEEHHCPSKRVKKKSGTSIIARFCDNSDSTILKFLKFLTKLLDQAIPYSAAIIKVWLDKTFVYFNCGVH